MSHKNKDGTAQYVPQLYVTRFQTELSERARNDALCLFPGNLRWRVH